MVSYVDDDADDECFDDPITLLDFEQRRFMNINQIGTTVEEPAFSLEDSSECTDSSKTELYISSYGKRSLTLPISFFNISRNISLLKECRPLTINIVDCNIYPWYYKKQKYAIECIVDLDDEIEDEDECQHTDLIVLPNLNDIYQHRVAGTTDVASALDNTSKMQNYSGAGLKQIFSNKVYPGIYQEEIKKEHTDYNFHKIVIIEDNNIENKLVKGEMYKAYNDINKSDDQCFEGCNFTEAYSQSDVRLPPIIEAKYNALKRKLSVNNEIVNLIDKEVEEPYTVLKSLLSENNCGSMNQPSQDYEILSESNKNNIIGPNDLKAYKEIAKSIIQNVKYDEANTFRCVEKPESKTSSNSVGYINCTYSNGNYSEKDKARDNVTGSPLLPCNTTPAKKKQLKGNKPAPNSMPVQKGVENSGKPCEQVMHTANKVIPHYHTIFKLATSPNPDGRDRWSYDTMSNDVQTSYSELNKIPNRNAGNNYKNYMERSNTSDSTNYKYQNTFEGSTNMPRPAVNNVFGTPNHVSQTISNGPLLNNNFVQHPVPYTHGNPQNKYQRPKLPRILKSQTNCRQEAPTQYNDYLRVRHPEQLFTPNDNYRISYGNTEHHKILSQHTSTSNTMPPSLPSVTSSSSFTSSFMPQIPESNRNTANRYFNNPPLNQTGNYLGPHAHPPPYYMPVTRLDQARLPVYKAANTKCTNPNMKITSNRINYNMEHYLWWSHIFPKLQLPSPQSTDAMNNVTISNNSNITMVPDIKKVTTWNPPAPEPSNGAGSGKCKNQKKFKNNKKVSSEVIIPSIKPTSANKKGQVRKRVPKSKNTFAKGNTRSVLEGETIDMTLNNYLTTGTAKLLQNNLKVTGNVSARKNASPPILPVLSFQTTYEYFNKIQRNGHNLNSNTMSIENANDNPSGKRKMENFDSFTNSKKKAVDDATIDKALKKISIQEYKKRIRNRILENGKMNNVIGISNKDDLNPENSREIVSPGDIQDQGYDSDSTVVLDIMG